MWESDGKRHVFLPVLDLHLLASHILFSLSLIPYRMMRVSPTLPPPGEKRHHHSRVKNEQKS